MPVARILTSFLLIRLRVDFEAVYSTSVEHKDWNGNLLKNGIGLKPGATVKVRFPGKETSVMWDLNIVDDAGLSVRFHNVNLAGADWIILVHGDGKINAIVE